MSDEPVSGSNYDAEADVLYTWIGPAAVPAISIATVDGDLIRVDPDTGELVGVTLFGWRRRLEGIKGDQ